MRRFNSNYEAQRFALIGAVDAKEYAWRYRRAALDLKRKYGRRSIYRFEWLESAWSFRHLLRGVLCH